MWKRLKTSNLYISCSENYEIYVTDYVSVWFKYFSKSSLVCCLKECNSLLEMSDDVILQKGHLLLTCPEKLRNLVIQHEDSTLILNMTMMFGYPFKLSLKLSESSKELFFKKITQPLLKTVLEGKDCQTELCQLLNKKDGEIEEYKCAGGEIAIKHLKTKPFNEQAVMTKYATYENIFGSTNDMINNLVAMDLKIPENVKSEAPDESTQKVPVKVKEEPINQNQSTINQTENVTIKTEPNSQIIPIKSEPTSQNTSELTQVLESQSSSSVSDTIIIKNEPEVIKKESQTVPMRKKLKLF